MYPLVKVNSIPLLGLIGFTFSESFKSKNWTTELNRINYKKYLILPVYYFLFSMTVN